MRVVLEGVTFRHGDTPALADVSLSTGEGARLAVLGRSGAGKTTLLRVIAGLAVPESGVVRLGNREATRGGELLLQPEERRVGLVFQELALWPHMTVERTLTWVARADGREARRAAARALAERVGLAGRLSSFPSELSGGERQRLAFARALASEPEVLLLDEPFAHLDAPLREELAADLLSLLAERKTTLIVVTHQRETALRLASDLLVLDAGVVQDAGEVDALLERPTRPVTALLLGLGSVVPGTLATKMGAQTSGQISGDGAVLVRPEQVVLLTGGDELPKGVVTSCVVARPDSGGRRYDVVALVEGHAVRAATERVWAVGEQVHLEVEGPCHPLLP